MDLSPDEPPELDLVEPPPSRCDSCGADDEELVRVRRIYLDPTAEGPGSERVVDEVEWWCLPCRTHYPHQVQG